MIVSCDSAKCSQETDIPERMVAIKVDKTTRAIMLRLSLYLVSISEIMRPIAAETRASANQPPKSIVNVPAASPDIPRISPFEYSGLLFR